MLPYLDEERVRSLLRIEDLLPAMERALVDFSAGHVVQPTRQMLKAPAPGAHFAAMPAAGEVAMGAKLVTLYPGNAAVGLPTHLALIVLFRPETGEPLAIMDGRLITELRTAAVSAVATRALALPDASVLAILGSGVPGPQPCRGAAPGAAIRGGSGLEFARLRTRSSSRSRSAGGQCPRLTRCATPTWWLRRRPRPSRSSLGSGSSLGAHVNAIGWAGPNGRELDGIAMTHNIVIANSRDAVMRKSGDVLLSGAKISRGTRRDSRRRRQCTLGSDDSVRVR